MPVDLLWLTMVSIPDYFRIIWVIEIFSILSDTQPVMLLDLKGCGKKASLKQYLLIQNVRFLRFPQFFHKKTAHSIK